MTMPKNLTAFRGQILIWVDVSKRAVGSTIGAWSDILPGDLVVQPLPLFRPNWLNFSFLLQKYENFYNCKYKVPGEGQGVGGGTGRGRLAQICTVYIPYSYDLTKLFLKFSQ